MRFKGILFVRRTIAQVRLQQDERRALLVSFGIRKGASDGLEVIPIIHGLSMPAIGRESLLDIFRKSEISGSRQRNVVVIIKADELTEPQMASQGSGLRNHTFHQIAIARQDIRSVINDLVPGSVIPGCEKGFRHRHPHSIPKPLAEWPGSHFNSGCEAAFWMSWGLAAPLAELLDVVEGEVISRKVQQTIQQHRPMAGR